MDISGNQALGVSEIQSHQHVDSQIQILTNKSTHMREIDMTILVVVFENQALLSDFFTSCQDISSRKVAIFECLIF